MKYRRLYAPGGMYFFTVVTEKRRPVLIENIDLLRESFLRAKHLHPFTIEAIVVLPDHLHTIWRLPESDADYSLRWMLIKKQFSYALTGFRNSESKTKKREKGVWQRRFWEHLIRDEEDLHRHFNYIHFNPVKHNLVKRPIDWKFSSFDKYVKQGFYSQEWGDTEPDSLEGVDLE